MMRSHRKGSLYKNRTCGYF